MAALRFPYIKLMMSLQPKQKHPGCKKVQGLAKAALWVSPHVIKTFDIN